MSDRLVRETNPPEGRIASPTPQYWNPIAEVYEKSEGVDGAIKITALAEQIADLKSLLDSFDGTDFALDASLVALKDSVDVLIARDRTGYGTPTYASEPAGYSYLDANAGDLYFSDGTQWVKKLEGIWA